MQRSCFLCQTEERSGEVEILERAVWSLPNLPPIELGFGLCRSCGLVLQSPSASPAEMTAWYRDQAVYTSPGRDGAPHPRKVRGTTRLIRSVEHALGRSPESAFQIGCSDGYTLSRFRSAGTQTVIGLDPSPASVKIAHERYDLDMIVGTIEGQNELPTCEVWILTHVLEHLHDPLATLRLAHNAGAARPEWLVIEVPLFERPDDFPPGYLSFEHLNYFTEDSLVRLVNQAGYEVVSLDKQFDDDIYPVVALVARVGEQRELQPLPGERERSRACLEHYLARERDSWSRIEDRLRTSVVTPERLFLWGGGVFASQLLANTKVEALTGLTGILDSSEHRWGSRLGSHTIFAPHEVALTEGDCIVISSFASETEIWTALEPERERGVQVIRLHQ